jgi:hypothetical protein
MRIKPVCGNRFDDLNAQAAAWCNSVAADWPCPEQHTLTVREAFAEEATRMLPLPDNPFPLLERVAIKVGKTPYVRFDLNDYTVPHTSVQRVLTVLADPHEVRIVDGAELLASHRRSYDKGAQIEVAAHRGPDPVEDATVLGPIKAKPAGGREDAASLDRPCARRLRELAVGMEECSRRGSNQRMRPKRARKPTISNRWFSGNFRLALTPKSTGFHKTRTACGTPCRFLRQQTSGRAC